MIIEHWFIMVMLAVQGIVWFGTALSMMEDKSASGFGPIVGIVSVLNFIALYFYVIQCGWIAR